MRKEKPHIYGSETLLLGPYLHIMIWLIVYMSLVKGALKYRSAMVILTRGVTTVFWVKTEISSLSKHVLMIHMYYVPWSSSVTGYCLNEYQEIICVRNALDFRAKFAQKFIHHQFHENGGLSQS